MVLNNMLSNRKAFKLASQIRHMVKKTQQQRESYLYNRWVEQLMVYADMQYVKELGNGYRGSTFSMYIKEGMKRYAP